MKGKKKKQQTKKKHVGNPRASAQQQQHLDPLEKALIYASQVKVSESCTRKLWKTTPRHCTPNLVRPWLVLPDADTPNNDILRREWERHWWPRHYHVWLKCSCCANGQRQGSELTWTKEERSLEDPNSSHKPSTIQFTNAIVFDKKVYALSLQGTLATMDIDSHPRLQVLNVQRAIPSTMSKGFRECLVECNGELMVIFLISSKSMNIVDDVEVYRLDTSTQSWIKMTTLGDHALLASHSRCVAILASKLGYRSNCVYFTQVRDGGWWVFNMKDRSISPSWARDSSHRTPTILTTKSDDH